MPQPQHEGTFSISKLNFNYKNSGTEPKMCLTVYKVNVFGTLGKDKCLCCLLAL